MSLWWIMEGQKQQQQQQLYSKSRVAKVNSEESWNMFITQAKNQGFPVSYTHYRLVLVALFSNSSSWLNFLHPACSLGFCLACSFWCLCDLALQVFVHFGASWCVPSLAMNAFFEELAMTYKDILFILVDVDEAKVRDFDCGIYFFERIGVSSFCKFNTFDLIAINLQFWTRKTGWET